MGERSSNIARTRQAELKQQPQESLFDTHPEVSLDFETVRQAARQKYTRPFLILDTAIVRGKIRRFRAAMPRVRPHYAVKANPDRRVLKVLVQEGAGFEIARPPSSTCFSASACRRRGLLLQPDEVARVDRLRRGQGRGVVRHRQRGRAARIHEVKPDAKQYLRIATPNIGSDWPLSGKFGPAPPTHADHRHGGEARRRPRRGDLPRRLAMPQSGKLARGAREGEGHVRRHDQGGPRPRLLNIGGGYPGARRSRTRSSRIFAILGYAAPPFFVGLLAQLLFAQEP